MANNRLNGSIPPEFGDLTRMEYLWISETATVTRIRGAHNGADKNNLSGGPIPAEFGKLTSLGQLLAKGAHLPGAIPPSFGHLVNLSRLDLEDNDITEIPSELGNLGSAAGRVDIFLARTTLRRSRPWFFVGTVSGRLLLNDNNLTGSIPPELGPTRPPWRTNVASLTVTPTATEASATVTVNGAAVASGSTSDAIGLEVGENVITVVVTAQDGTTSSTYTVTVTRATPVPVLPLGGTLLLGILLVCLGGRRYWGLVLRHD